MTKSDEYYSNAEKLRLLKEIADGLRPYEIAALHPHRTTRAIYTKIRYEKYKELNKSLRIGRPYGARQYDETPVSDADAVSSNLDNQLQDARFQTALRVAIETGLEKMPIPQAPTAEFRPVQLDRAPAMVSYGASPAALCASLGAS